MKIKDVINTYDFYSFKNVYFALFDLSDSVKISLKNNDGIFCDFEQLKDIDFTCLMVRKRLISGVNDGVVINSYDYNGVTVTFAAEFDLCVYVSPESLRNIMYFAINNFDKKWLIYENELRNPLCSVCKNALNIVKNDYSVNCLDYKDLSNTGMPSQHIIIPETYANDKFYNTNNFNFHKVNSEKLKSLLKDESIINKGILSIMITEDTDRNINASFCPEMGYADIFLDLIKEEENNDR